MFTHLRTHTVYIFLYIYMYIYVHITCTSFYKPNVELWLGPGLIVGDPWCHRAPNAGGELFDLVARTVALKLWQRDGFGSAKKCAKMLKTLLNTYSYVGYVVINHNVLQIDRKIDR